MFVAAVRALPTEIKVESGTSQSKSRTSVNLGERVRIGWFNGLLIYHFHMGTSPSTWIYKYNSRDLVFERREHSEEVREPVPVGYARPGIGCWVQGVRGEGLRVEVLGFRACGVGCGAWVQGFGFRVLELKTEFWG